jgi:hypothetical protein
MMISSVAAFMALHGIVGGHIVWPWQFAAGLRSHTNPFVNLLQSLPDRTLIYEFIWLLPLGLVRLRDLPRPWVYSCAAAVAAAFALNAIYHGQPGTVGRAVHSIAGPLLSLSVARLFSSERGING